MNPDRMRSDYGKLMYLLMDACEPDIQDLLDFNCVRPLRTGGPALWGSGCPPRLMSLRRMLNCNERSSQEHNHTNREGIARGKEHTSRELKIVYQMIFE